MTVLVCLATLAVPPAAAAFTAAADSVGNAWSAAATFPDYPASVIADHPLVYYRLDEAPGSITATDSSGHGTTGVYGTAELGAWAGLWPLDEGSGGTAADLSGAATPHGLTVNGAAWTPSGRSGSALSFDGTSAYAATSSTVMPTSSSFTVSAWVYLTSTATSRTAVSQSGAEVSAFELGYDSATDRWVFTMPRSDSAAAAVDVVSSDAAPALNTWTQLTATYDSGTNGMALYVNGVPQTGAVFGGTPWNATGSLEVGAGLSTARTHFWAGSIDAVRVLSGAVTQAAALELTLGPSGGAATAWPLDENGGTSTVDDAGGLNTGTLGSSASWSVPHSGAAAVDLPGDADGYVAGSSSAVNTASSFTVAAWVYLDHTALWTMSRVAVSQSGTVKSGFILRYNHFGNRWQFAVSRGAADDFAANYDSSYSALDSAALTTWTHLVGVHDAGSQTVTLYVNGVAQTPAAHSSTFDATGPLQVGRVKEWGNWQTGDAGLEGWAPWAGRVDEVKLFRRALDAAEITALYHGASAGSSTGAPGALQGAQQGQSSSTAQAFARNARASYVPVADTNPTTYSLECWFRSRGVSGADKGQTLFSFSAAAAGNTALHDRRVFLDTSGHLVAGTGSGTTGAAVTSSTYTDGAWHHVVATVSPANGINLYVDGNLAASAAYSAPGNFTGYWRWGGDTWDGSWPTDYFRLGQLDEVAIYPAELSATGIAVHYHANH